LTALVFSIAGSATLPSLILALFWKRLTAAGIVTSVLTGSIGSVLLIVLSPTIQGDILGAPERILFPLRNPAIVTIPLSFLAAWLVSLATQRDVDSLQYSSLNG
jgi:cation/acetate symporter